MKQKRSQKYVSIGCMSNGSPISQSCSGLLYEKIRIQPIDGLGYIIICPVPVFLKIDKRCGHPRDLRFQRR